MLMVTIKSLAISNDEATRTLSNRLTRQRTCSFYMQKGEIISVKEARKLLGQKAKNLTNEELKGLIIHTETVLRIAVRRYVGSINTNKSGTIDPGKVSKI